MNRRYLAVALKACAALVTMVGAAAPAAACSVCMGEPGDPMVEGAKSGVLFMIAVTYGLLLCGVALGATWFVRARRLRARRVESEPVTQVAERPRATDRH